MRTIFIILLLFLLAACVADAPQVTVTSEVTVTLLPLTATAIPTPTLYPQFVTLQDQIAASGERFDLLPDGTIQETIPDGVKVVPGLSVDKNGQIKLMVDGQEIVIASTDVTFDDDRGVIVERYSFDQQKNEWLPAVGLTLS